MNKARVLSAVGAAGFLLAIPVAAAVPASATAQSVHAAALSVTMAVPADQHAPVVPDGDKHIPVVPDGNVHLPVVAGGVAALGDPVRDGQPVAPRVDWHQPVSPRIDWHAPVKAGVAPR